MKKLILFILLSSYSHSQQESKTQSIDPFTLAQRLNALAKKPTAEEREAQKIKTQLVIMSLRIERMQMVEEAKIMQQQLINKRRQQRLDQQSMDREYRIANAWHNSITGKSDGRSWYDLDYAEQADYRLRFYTFFQR